MAQSRSTKGASKQRRDAINERVGQIRELIPVSEVTRTRLSQLQVMALARSFIAKSNVFSALDRVDGQTEDRSAVWSEHFDFLQAVPGFLLIAGLDGKILYVSDNVCDYLGNSAVDVITQTETLYELIDEKDHVFVTDTLDFQDGGNVGVASALETNEIVSFVCRMTTAARNIRYAASPIRTRFERFRTMQVRGRLVMANYMTSGVRAIDNGAALVAICTPSLSGNDAIVTSSTLEGSTVAWDTSVFKSHHGLDMKFLSIDDNGSYQLGYDKDLVFGKSWYEMIHPDHLAEAQSKHGELIQSGDVRSWRTLCMRVQTGRGDFIWLHVVMRLSDINNDVTGSHIVCMSQVLDDAAASAIHANSVMEEMETTSRSGGHLNTLELELDSCNLLDEIFPPPTYHSLGTKRQALAPMKQEWIPSKVARYNMAETTYSECISIPSPPLCKWEQPVHEPLHHFSGDYVCQTSTATGTGSYTQISPFRADRRFSSYVPESFLTPSASPCSSSEMVNSPATMPCYDVGVYSTGDPNLDGTVDEVTFFDSYPEKKPAVPEEHIFMDHLPELDLSSVTSYFDDLDQYDLTMPDVSVLGGPSHVPSKMIANSVMSADDLILANLFGPTQNIFRSCNMTSSSMLMSPC